MAEREGNQNIVLFPKWQEKLLENSQYAIQQQRYEDALENYNQLLNYNIESQEIYTGKLLCLMELGNLSEAEELCDKLLAEKSEGFNEYIHVYSTLLFQSGQYERIVGLLEDIFDREEISGQFKEQLTQIYELSKSLNDDKKTEQSYRLISEFKQAVNDQDLDRQWRIISQWRSLPVYPHLEYLSNVLKGQVNPVVKTAIIQLFIASKIDQDIVITKFNQQCSINPSKSVEISEHESIKEILSILDVLEQSNPTLFDLIKRLLYRFLYVTYPFIISKDDYQEIAEALNALACEFFQLHDSPMEVDSKVKEYMKTILECDRAYLAIIEE